MPLYTYKAINDLGRIIRGTINGANEVDLETRLKGIGLDLVSCKETNEKHVILFNHISNKDLILLCSHLEQLERAGVPILDSLSDLRDTAESTIVKNLMADLFESVRGGSMLSAAMAEHPKVFDHVFIGLVQAGEKTGQLAQIFSHLSNHLKWVVAIRNKIRKATTYPIFLLLLMASIISMMMLFVVPKLSNFLISQSLDLPFSTRALIATSHAFQNYWYLIFGIPIIALIVIKVFIKTSDSFAYLIDNFKLMIPVIGTTIHKIEMARFCRFFAITFKSGIGVLDCLEIASGVVNNRLIKESIITASRSVYDGNSLTVSLRIAGQFPNLVLRMFKVGEDSGRLDEALETVNFFYDKEVNDSVENMIGMVQPVLTMFLGAILAWVCIAVFGPLYGSFSKLSF
jgi:type IV pilus assembly protein PilC